MDIVSRPAAGRRSVRAAVIDTENADAAAPGHPDPGGATMLFCITANYTPAAITALMANPETSRVEAVRRLVEAAGGKLVSFYSTAAEGPGVLAILDLPDPQAAFAIGGVVNSTGAIQNYRMTRLIAPEEVVGIRRKAAQLKPAYMAPS
jgi:uncharacterized protein with GYD domain